MFSKKKEALIKTLNEAFRILTLTPKEATLESSGLLQELYDLEQPLKLCYERNLYVRYCLNLHERTFQSKKQDFTAQFVIDGVKTTDDKVVIWGYSHYENYWKLEITRQKMTHGHKEYPVSMHFGNKKDIRCKIHDL